MSAGFAVGGGLVPTTALLYAVAALGVAERVHGPVAGSCLLAMAVRGACTSLQLGDGAVRTRNPFSTRTVQLSRIERIGLLRHAGMFKGETPALVVSGRRLRVPLYPATMWGGVWRSDFTDADARIASVLVQWADDREVEVEPALRSVIQRA